MKWVKGSSVYVHYVQYMQVHLVCAYIVWVVQAIAYTISYFYFNIFP